VIRLCVRALAVAGSCTLLLLAGGVGVASAARGDVRVLALVPSPYFPALPHVMAGNVYEGTYDNPSGDRQPSKVFEFSAAGALVRSWTVQGQDVSKPHGVQVAANDTRGRLLLLDKTSGRIIRLDPRTGGQTLYSRVPDLRLCGPSQGPPCSPALVDLAPMPDYAVWGPDGSLYVTDYQQAVIWRIPPGGGAARVWLADRRLDGGPFGTACVTMLPDHRTLLFDQASNGGLGGLNPTTGKLYSVALEPGDRPGALRQLWESGPADAPDGCAVARSGDVYLALVGLSNQIVELSPAGTEIARFGQQYTGANNSPVPFDSPSGVAFLGTQLIIANQSYFADNHANQALLALETGEAGQPVYVPANAGVAPARAKHKKRRPERRTEREKRKRHRHRPR
jgi:sugar lactone lactonase YvrE